MSGFCSVGSFHVQIASEHIGGVAARWHSHSVSGRRHLFDLNALLFNFPQVSDNQAKKSSGSHQTGYE